MRLKIHRGTHESGGSCVELCSNSAMTRIIIDGGMPLVASNGSPFEWRHYKGISPEQLFEQKILPSIDGVYSHQKPSVAAVILSHAHLDHYGLFRFIHPDISLHMSPGTKSLVEASNLFLNTGVNLDNARIFTMWRPFRVEEFIITPYLMDRSAPDAAAFLIEADEQRLFYTGDFRGHSRKRVLFERLLANPISNIDCLVMEGSMIGRDEGQYHDEAAVEQAIYDVIAEQQSYTFVFCSSQNLDRLRSIYRAVKRAGKKLIIDLYTAFVLDKLSSISSSIPQFDWREIRVLYIHSHALKLAEYNKDLLYKYQKTKIGWEEIQATPQNMVILSKDSSYFRTPFRKLGADGKAKSIYSMWHGYLGRTDLPQFLSSHNIKLIEIHTSGHAYVEDLKKLASTLNPRCVVPINNFHPDQYGSIHENIVRLDDSQVYYL